MKVRMDSDREFLDQFEDHLDAINKALQKPLNSRVPLVKDIGRHSLLGQGKRLRPLLFVCSANLCGYAQDDVYQVSTVFEYLHTASLLHDDVLDNAETRRKKPSVRHLWGNSAAVLGGDFLYSRASAVAIERDNPEIIRVLNQTATQMVEGQLLELTHTNNWGITKDEYMEIITSKTAVLMSAACCCGAILASAEKRAADRLAAFGLDLGIAFQMIDDVLDYTSSQEQFGKPVGKDLREGKITLPLIYSFPGLEKQEIKRLAELFRNQRAGEEDYRRVVTMVRTSGVRC